MNYLRNLWQSFDRFLNTVFAGTDKEYLSSRVYRYKDINRVAGLAYRALNWLDKDHCEKAYADCQIGMDPEDDVWK